MNEIEVIRVEPGDTLSEIAVRHGVSVDELQRWNGIEDPDLLQAGQRIVICAGADTHECSVSGSAVSQTAPGSGAVAVSWDVWMGGVIVLAFLMFLFRPKRGLSPARETRRSRNRLSSTAHAVSETKRTGLARMLFAILHPRHARSASVNAEAVRLVFGSRSADIPLGDVEAVDVSGGGLYSGVHIRHGAGSAHVSGLPRTDAAAFADALETERCKWWRRTLARQLETLRSVHDRLTALADPPRYLTVDALRGLEAEARTIAGGIAARWPEALADAPEVRMLRDILEFEQAPDDARAKANEAFVVNELVRSREFFDRIEARPLTEEQRRAVVIDERRNLVVAAAGSGKTSVIVAKTGWLIRKGYRKPSELLLLAFARDARREMEERLGGAIARDVTVRTFHGLGMAIIGETEGKRPALAATAEDDRTLFDLLKGIVTDLLADRDLSATLDEWFQEGFAPYRSCLLYTSPSPRDGLLSRMPSSA